MCELTGWLLAIFSVVGGTAAIGAGEGYGWRLREHGVGADTAEKVSRSIALVALSVYGAVMVAGMVANTAVCQ